MPSSSPISLLERPATSSFSTSRSRSLILAVVRQDPSRRSGGAFDERAQHPPGCPHRTAVHHPDRLLELLGRCGCADIALRSGGYRAQYFFIVGARSGDNNANGGTHCLQRRHSRVECGSAAGSHQDDVVVGRTQDRRDGGGAYLKVLFGGEYRPKSEEAKRISFQTAMRMVFFARFLSTERLILRFAPASFGDSRCP